MSTYNAKYLRDCLADVPDDEPVIGILILRSEMVAPDGTEIPREKWEQAVDEWERGGADLFQVVSDSAADAVAAVCPENDGEN